jgi:membrane protein
MSEQEAEGLLGQVPHSRPRVYYFHPSHLLSASWWKLVLKALYRAGVALFQDDGPHWAAAIAYYALFSLFPLLLAGISLASYFVDTGWAIVQITRLLGEVLPQGEEEIVQIVFEVIEARGSVGIISLVGLLWSGTRVFGVITKVLNIAYDVDEFYTFFRRTLIEFVMLLTIGLMVVVALLAGPVLPLIFTLAERPFRPPGAAVQLLQQALPAVLILLALFLIYRYVPRRRISKIAALAGTLVAGILFFAARPIFTTYIQNFGNYNLIYGSITAIIVLILWVWLTALILIYGGEVAAHVQFMILDGLSARQVEERHLERNPTHPSPNDNNAANNVEHASTSVPEKGK